MDCVEDGALPQSDSDEQSNQTEGPIRPLKAQSHRGRRLSLLFIGWCGFIFATSCTVVLPQELFGLIQYSTGIQPESLRRFELFWGSAWVLFVKGWHFTEFAVLTILGDAAIRWLSGATAVWPIYASMIFCFVFAVSDEWHQSFVPARRGTVEDVVIDSFGILVSGAILLLLYHRRDNRMRRSNTTTPEQVDETTSQVYDSV